jgi:phytoene dehydrogenase-like protein
MRALGLDLQRDLLDLFAASAGDFLDSWFESAPIKAVFGFDSVVGNYASPYTPGSGYVLLHHSFGEVNGKKGVWGHAIGGMGAITQAMAKAADAHGVEIRLSTRVRRVLVENGRAIGVETDNGEPLPPPRRFARPARGISAAHGEMALRVSHVSHECRAFRITRLRRLARTASASSGTISSFLSRQR